MAPAEKTVVVEIRDEQTHWILVRAAWGAAATAVGGFGDRCWVGCSEGEDEYRACRQDAAERMRAFELMSALTERFEQAQIGERVEVPDSVVDELRDAILTTADAINNRGWSSDRQERLEWLYPAAVRIGTQLHGTEAVA